MCITYALHEWHKVQNYAQKQGAHTTWTSRVRESEVKDGKNGNLNDLH